MSTTKQQGFECPKCKNNYSTAYSMYRHLRKVHNCDINKCVTLYCPIENCNQSYDRYNALDTHLALVHYADIRKETFNFSDLTDFEAWLRDITSSSKTKYIKRSCNNSYRYYRCHRSGLPKTSTEKINSMKSSVKIGRHCPSRIIAKITDRNVQVEFVPTHIGHECEIAKIPLSQKKRRDIACRLASSSNGSNSVAASVAAVAVPNDESVETNETASAHLTTRSASAALSTGADQTTIRATNLQLASQTTTATTVSSGQQFNTPNDNTSNSSSNNDSAAASDRIGTAGVGQVGATDSRSTTTLIPNRDTGAGMMMTLAPLKPTDQRATSLAGHPQSNIQQHGTATQTAHILQPANNVLAGHASSQLTDATTNSTSLGLMTGAISPNRQDLTSRFEQLLGSIRSDKHASIVKAQLEVCFALIRD